MTAASRPRPGPGGFTLVELSIASGLTALLSVMLITAWSAYDRAAAEVIARCRLAQEADLAILELAADLGTQRSPSSIGPKGRGRPTGILVASDHSSMRILFEDVEAPEDSRAVIYEVQEESQDLAYSGERIRRQQWVRRVESLDPPAIVEVPRVVAWDAKGVDFRAFSEGWYEFRLTFSLPFRGRGTDDLRLERTYTLLAKVP